MYSTPDKIVFVLIALALASDVKNLFTAMQSMVNQGELDGLELLQGFIKDLKSYNTAENSHKEQEIIEPTKNSGKNDPNLIRPSSWNEYEEPINNVDDLMEAKSGKYDGKMSRVNI